MFSLRVVLPVYKLNEWRNLQTSGEIIATWTGDDLLNGDEVIKKQAAQWLEKQQSESQIVSDYNELLDSKTKVERALRQVQRELKLNQSKLDLLKKFFAGLGFEPDSEYLKVVDNTLKQLQVVVVEDEDEDEDEGEDEGEF